MAPSATRTGIPFHQRSLSTGAPPATTIFALSFGPNVLRARSFSGGTAPSKQALVHSPSPLLAKRDPRSGKTESVFAFSIRFANAPDVDARCATPPIVG